MVPGSGDFGITIS